jgi:hypothetical protein
MATRTAIAPYLLRRARVVRPGQCVSCGCTPRFACSGGCAWVPGTQERLCTAHGQVDSAQAVEALAEADRKERRP